MFAYCNNNPANNVDCGGELSARVPTLWDFYRMHKAVQYDVAEEYGYAIEVYTKGPLGRGFLDIYDPVTNQYYEVKSIGAAGSAAPQMDKYDVSSISDWRFLGYDIAYSPSRGTRMIKGTITCGNWYVTYESNLDGLITYNYFEIDSSSTSTYAVAAGVAAGLMLFGSSVSKEAYLASAY